MQAAEFLKGFHGCLVKDGYSGYKQVEGVICCGCWAHMRRKWRDAMPKGATVQTSQAAVGYNFCNKLFALERKYSGMNKEDRKYARQAEPLLDTYWLWLGTLDLVPGSKLEEAVTYTKYQEETLRALLGYDEIDNFNPPTSNRKLFNLLKFDKCGTFSGAKGIKK